eukprot:TRINITY_DN2787_c2_g1_i2.p1 TRINITY_DN2787_c2_g1~~TRINITY_DN2787_c2_g1_i2.p1  ORF type:complete len:560 (-),score=24.39 TRINITY_DN2787_c2_g1_i2:915-2594(-)
MPNYDRAFCFSGQFVPRQIRRQSTHGTIGTIATTRVDLSALVKLDSKGLLAGVIELIRDPDTFRAALVPGAESMLGKDISFKRCTSRHMLAHAPKLLEYGVIERPPPGSSPKIVMPLFTVEKKDKSLRVVSDARKLNKLTAVRVPMLLPSVHEVVDRILDARFVVLHDARSWFFQFTLHSEIRRFFAVNLAGARGKFDTYLMSVMSMGWTLAPCIAQRSALALLSDLPGLAWVDNFALLAGSEAEATSLDYEFRRRCTYANVALNDEPEYGKPLSTFIFLGIEFQLDSARYHMSPEWVRKAVSAPEWTAVEVLHLSRRQFFRLIGRVVWWSFVTRVKLCCIPATLSLLSRLSKDIAADSSAERYEKPLQLSNSVAMELNECRHRISLNVWLHKIVPPTEVVEIWTDASTPEWAIIAEGVPFFAQGTFAEDFQDAHIFYKELLAAHQAIVIASRLISRRVKLVLKIDNLPVVRAYTKGHSSSFKANTVLRESFRDLERGFLTLVPEWTPTDKQKADPYTRGEKVPSHGLRLDAGWFRPELRLSSPISTKNLPLSITTSHH